MCAALTLFSFLSTMATQEAPLTPFKDLRVSFHQIPAFGRIPNTSIQKKPMMIHRSAFHTSASASTMESHLSAVGVVTQQWRYTMYSQSHFHSTAHEALCVAHGMAKLCFGGKDNPKKVEPVLEKGDVMVVPAGVAYRLLEDIEGGFNMVGWRYPKGKNWDMCYGNKGEEEEVKGIWALGWFERDPTYGDEGPALQVGGSL